MNEAVLSQTGVGDLARVALDQLEVARWDLQAVQLKVKGQSWLYKALDLTTEAFQASRLGA